MSTSTQQTETQNDDVTAEDECQSLMDYVINMRHRYSYYVADRLMPKIVEGNKTILEKKLNSHKKVKFRLPKYDCDIEVDFKSCENLRAAFKKHKETIKKIETLRKIVDQIKNDPIGRVLSEDIDSKTFIKRIQKKMSEKQEINDKENKQA